MSRRKFETINLAHLEKLTNHNQEKIGKYIEIFLRNLSTDLVDLKQHAIEQDWAGVKKVAHKMKGTTSYMGIKELETIFVSAQYLCEDEVNTAEFSKTLTRIEALCEVAVKELTEVKENL